MSDEKDERGLDDGDRSPRDGSGSRDTARREPPVAPESGHGDQEKLKKSALRVALIVGAIAVVLAIWGVASRLLDRSHLRARTSQDAELTVVTVKPELSAADDELILPGTVLAFMEAPIYARASGFLKGWYTDIGTRVHKGQLLAEIEAPELDRELGQAKADLGTAHANAVLAQTTNTRWQALVVKQAVSRQDADEKAGDAAAKAAAETSAEQNVDRLKALESFKRVVAPFEGVITARNTDVGALINAGESSGTELFRIADIHKLRVYAQVPEAFSATTKSGLKAELHFTERPGQAFPVETMRTSNALDPTARTLQVELQLDNRQREFLPGSYTEIHFKLPSPTKTFRVPSNTILFRSEGLQVATVDDSKKIKLKNITQGRDFGKTVEVLAGLTEDDQVIVNPSDSIEDGTRVRIAPPPPKNSSNQGNSNAGGSGKGSDSKGSDGKGADSKDGDKKDDSGTSSGGKSKESSL